MPSEGVELSPNGHILTDEEVVRLAELFVRNGVTKIRLTGGEPTVRKGLVNIVGELGSQPACCIHPNSFGSCEPRTVERASEIRAYFYRHDKQRDSTAPETPRLD